MGVMVGKYHLFKRGRKNGDFYCCWFQQGNKRIIKTCGRACTGKRETAAYIIKELIKETVNINGNNKR